MSTFKSTLGEAQLASRRMPGEPESSNLQTFRRVPIEAN
jgi:hypothetical protein